MLKYPILISLLSAVIFNSCKTSAPKTQVVTETPALIQIGTEKFTATDFLDSYTKNKFASDSVKELTAEEYLPVYRDQKIKMLAARQEGLDTTNDYKEEINSYYDQLAKNFLVDKVLVEKLSTEAYARMKQEVKASHILIAIPEDASPKDTMDAYNAAVALRGRLEEGADFSDMAAKFSKDPSAVHNKGDLGYFTVFQTVYPFETTAYNLPVGKISQPVRSKTGYHIIKVNDRRASRGTVRIAHIMVKVDKKATEAQKTAAKIKIDEAYKKLQSGQEWDAVAESYSDDKQSSKNHGLLPPFGTGQMVPEVEETSFALTKPNAYAAPVLSSYGWHIIKLIEKKNLEPYSVMAPTLRQKVVTDSRGKVLDQATAKRLRTKYAVQEFADQYALFNPLIDSTLISGSWDYMKAVSTDWASNVLFTIEKRPYEALSFLNYIKTQQKPRPKGSAPEVIFKHYYNDYLTDRLFAYEKEHLEETYPEFKSQITEIRQGVLLDLLTEENVLQRSLTDSVGQQAYYQKNMEHFRYPERAFGTIVTAPDTATLHAVKRAIAKSPYLLERKANELIFKEGSSDLTQDQIDKLYDVYIILQKNPDYVVEVAGYRSSTEAETISADRIRKAVQYLSSKNISIVKILEKDYGSFRQSAEIERNRRISFQFYSQSKKDVEKVYNSVTPDAVIIQEGYFQKNNALLGQAKWEAGEQTLTANGLTYWIDIEKIEPARVKTFAEARGGVINEYQKVLEKQWLEKLQQKFPVKVNQQELEKIKR
ncbi:peptidylprolyl isomerase [Dyadobacter sp. CY356]|uniref:peptidylprolyl isomerase n=1 Tax=Dyadobacter sp. CY356 TaxID=2906442 RepID=UPI001F4594B3|nr:peptidylprolyl isomerase [Dyadobacter sp. CY356]MCF0054320.1 peptidylprolyl isomerase [Dyadobacter sp. CY356]